MGTETILLGPPRVISVFVVVFAKRGKFKIEIIYIQLIKNIAASRITIIPKKLKKKK